MKHLLIIGFLIVGVSARAQGFFEQADLFFSKYVDEGKVNYTLIAKEPKMLNDLVKEIAEHDISNKRVTQNYLKAFYINSYNILVIKQIVDAYPVAGPLEVEGFFTDYKHEVIGHEVSLNELEKQLLYAKFPDPRLHFVLVCAAKGCPPLAEFAYKPSILESTLTDRTEYVLNLDWFIRVTKEKVQVSEIFNWYKADFLKSSESIISFMNQYREQVISSRSALSYYRYDWTLNE